MLNPWAVKHSMGWKLFYCVLTLMVGLLECPSIGNGIILKTVNLKDNVTLPCNATCDIGIVWRIVDGQVVAKIDQGKLIEGKRFEKRVKINKDLSLTISSAVYNDKGSYECVCDNRNVADVKLDVLVPTEISAHVGDNVTLHCYGSTNKQVTNGEMYVQWEKDGQTVLKIDPTNTTYGPGFIDRTSVTRDGYGEGDLSLTFTGVRSSDQGTYLCFFNRDSDPGYPHGVTLTVKEKQLEPAMIDSERSRVPVIGIPILLLSIICVLGLLAMHKRNRRQPTEDYTVTRTEDSTMINVASPPHLSIEELPVPVQDSQPLPEVRRIQSCCDDHLDETTCPEGMDERTEEEEELHLPVAESGTLLEQKKSNTGS
ncbi:fibroblast growth factor receptor 3 [Salvelinus namaycush]|uniref:Fibroblast growth factor receptor 3 n=1 Tax=Salvelinus namaycush TaxID=8040 RepID=A0A8U0R615_SALNM|nr:fibroblast growth factor receptor 3 [Salvelinus namaycush]